MTEAIVQYIANLNDLGLRPKHNAINRASGGMGKNDASAKERIKSASNP